LSNWLEIYVSSGAPKSPPHSELRLNRALLKSLVKHLYCVIVVHSENGGTIASSWPDLFQYLEFFFSILEHSAGNVREIVLKASAHHPSHKPFPARPSKTRSGAVVF
jgi:hypothetical protein